MRSGKWLKTAVAILVLAILAAGSWAWFQRPPAGPRPDIRNVLLISIDTCRADYLSCYGYRLPTTPHIDAVAKEGVLYRRAQSTNPITLPAHCSMLTGTIPPYHGVHANINYTLDDSNLTLAEFLQKRGYATGAVVGAFPLDARFGLDQGFDTYDGQFDQDSEKDGFNERSAGKVSHRAVTWLEENRDKPFFLFVHFFDPHLPYAPRKPFKSMFRGDPYAAEIAYTDFCIGQVIEKLKALDLYDSTLTIITSDHGESLGDHGENTHAFFVYQSTIQVPLIVKAPGCTPGHTVENPVSLTDIMPTVLGALKLSVPEELEGIDLGNSLWDQEEPSAERLLYSESWYPAKFGCCPLRGVVQGKWRYIWSATPELYDLERDAGELQNRADEEPRVAGHLHNRLQDLLASRTRKFSHRRTAPDGVAADRLRSLGYVGGSVGDVPNEIQKGMYDPKDTIEIFNQYLEARMLRGQNRTGEAGTICLNLVTRRPKVFQVHSLLGDIAQDEDRLADAIAHYLDAVHIANNTQHARELNDVVSKSLNNVAWIQATAVDSQRRNIPDAIKNAEFAAELSGGQSVSVLDTLAVAYAADGRFDKAVEIAQQAVQLATRTGEEKTSVEIRARLQSFRQGKPYQPDAVRNGIESQNHGDRK